MDLGYVAKRSYAVPAASEAGVPGVLEILDDPRANEIDQGFNQRFFFPETADVIARDLAGDDGTKLASLGVMRCAGPVPTKDEIAACWKHRDEFLKKEIALADGEFSRHRDMKKISGHAKEGAVRFNLRREWNPLIESNETDICPFCRETIKAGAIVCRFCGRELQSSESLVAQTAAVV